MDLQAEAKGNQPGGPGPKEQKGHSRDHGPGLRRGGAYPCQASVTWPSHDSLLPRKPPVTSPATCGPWGAQDSRKGSLSDKHRDARGCTGLGRPRHSCQTCREVAASGTGNPALGPQEKGRPHCKGQAGWWGLTSDRTEAMGLISVPSTDS